MSSRRHLTDALRSVWSDLDALASGLRPHDWQTPVLPGWDVKDTLAHVIGTEKMLDEGIEEMRARVADAARPDGQADTAPHVRNAIGRTNEEWVEHFRAVSPADVLGELRSTTARRLVSLDQMSDEDFESSSWTPAGEGTYASFMRIRLFDCWMHDQDIRHAVGRFGFESGPAAEESLSEAVGALGFVVGKRGRAPEGSGVTFELLGPVSRRLHVDVSDRARVVDALGRDPDVTISLGSSLFMRLAGGRIAFEDVESDVNIEGDEELGRRIAAHLAFTV